MKAKIAIVVIGVAVIGVCLYFAGKSVRSCEEHGGHPEVVRVTGRTCSK